MTKPKIQLCPCGSKLAYANCCAPYLQQQATPTTALALMRSRYVAYHLGNIDYIVATMRERALSDFDYAEAQAWSASVKWLKLEILNHGLLSTNCAFVEFKAYYRSAQRKYHLHEKSEFKQDDTGRWYYTGMLPLESV